jgi:predicted ATPase
LKRKIIQGKQERNIINEIIVKEKFDEIFKQVGLDFDEDIFRSRRPSITIKEMKDGKSLNIRNLSTGMKTFLIIKTLLMNGTLQSNGTIILDEPEIHLHPEWQLLFAELIVLIQKNFEMHILLNTHSPYFLRAIQVYSAKHEIADRCKFYLSGIDESYASIRDVTNDIEQIYRKLAFPFQKLDDERWGDD